MTLFEDDLPAAPREVHTLAEVALGTGGTVRAVTGRCGAVAADLRVTALPTLVTCPECAAADEADRPPPAAGTVARRYGLCLACDTPTDGEWCDRHAALVERAANGGTGPAAA